MTTDLSQACLTSMMRWQHSMHWHMHTAASVCMSAQALLQEMLGALRGCTYLKQLQHKKLETKVKLMKHPCSKSIPEFIKFSVYQGAIVHQTVQLTAKHEGRNNLLGSASSNDLRFRLLTSDV